MNKIIFVIKA